MAKLNQIIAVEKDTAAKAHRAITDVYQQLQKPAPLAGISRSYQPKDEEGESLPSESTRVQVVADKLITEVMRSQSELLDVTATKDWTNCVAKADVVVDGVKILEQVPTTFLLFLEKKLIDIHTFISKLPTLDPAETWHHDPGQDCYATSPTKTTRTKKVPRNHVKAEATPHHPAQVEIFHEDVVVGYWTTIKYSGAMPTAQVNQILERVDKLRTAVKFAREEANGTTATQKQVGKALLDFLLGTR